MKVLSPWQFSWLNSCSNQGGEATTKVRSKLRHRKCRGQQQLPSNAASNAQPCSRFSPPPKARLHRPTPCTQRGQVTKGHVRWLMRHKEAHCFQNPPSADRAANRPRGHLCSQNALMSYHGKHFSSLQERKAARCPMRQCCADTA